MDKNIAELTDMIDNIKMNIPDKDYKNIMEKLGEAKKKKDTEGEELYLFTYVENTMEWRPEYYVEDNDYEEDYSSTDWINKITTERKSVVCKVVETCQGSKLGMERIIYNIESNDWNHMAFVFPQRLQINYPTLEVMRPYFHEISYGVATDGGDKVRIAYRNIIPISLKKWEE